MYCLIQIITFEYYKQKPFSQEELSGIRAAFDMIDTNGDGKICISELRRVVEQFGKELSDQDLRDMVKKLRKFYF